MKTKYLVRTVEDSSCVNHIFKTKKEMYSFLMKFNTKNKNREMDGWWVDLVVENIKGNIYDDGKLLNVKA